MPRDRIPDDVEQRMRAAARQHCGYCLSPQKLVMARLEIEHITPRQGWYQRRVEPLVVLSALQSFQVGPHVGSRSGLRR